MNNIINNKIDTTFLIDSEHYYDTGLNIFLQNFKCTPKYHFVVYSYIIMSDGNIKKIIEDNNYELIYKNDIFYPETKKSKESLREFRFIYKNENSIFTLNKKENFDIIMDDEYDEEEDMIYEQNIDDEQNNNSEKEYTIAVYHSDCDEFSKIQDFIIKNYKIKEYVYKRNLFILTNKSGGLHLEKLNIKNKKHLDLKNNYNNGFEEINKKIINLLNNEEKGLFLFHGEAGTGKTTYIRYLMSVVSTKKFIFIPPGMVNMLSSPSFIPLLIQHPNSILIIEDAEEAIKSRDILNNNDSISNLLNMADGLLGDVCGVQIICTCNTNKNNIDKAILRKGRLSIEYNFDKLSVEKTNNLLKSLYPSIEPINNELSLADIYNYNTDNNHASENDSLGFI